MLKSTLHKPNIYILGQTRIKTLYLGLFSSVNHFNRIWFVRRTQHPKNSRNVCIFVQSNTQMTEDGWKFDATASPGYQYAHNANLRCTIKRRSTLKSFSVSYQAISKAFLGVVFFSTLFWSHGYLAKMNTLNNGYID